MLEEFDDATSNIGCHGSSTGSRILNCRKDLHRRSFFQDITIRAVDDCIENIFVIIEHRYHDDEHCGGNLLYSLYALRAGFSRQVNIQKNNIGFREFIQSILNARERPDARKAFREIENVDQPFTEIVVVFYDYDADRFHCCDEVPKQAMSFQ